MTNPTPQAAQTPSPGDDAAASDVKAGELFRKIGEITRQLHTALGELGQAQQLYGAVEMIPDARKRLSYISRLTGEAAEKVLGRVEQAKDEQEAIRQATRQFLAQLQQDPDGTVRSPAFEAFRALVEERSLRMDSHLTEIMLAQDFHDLTGQVIARVVDMATDLEARLVQLLMLQAAPMAAVPASPPAAGQRPGPHGPAIDPNAKDVMADQKQVDDLLASLGF